MMEHKIAVGPLANVGDVFPNTECGCARMKVRKVGEIFSTNNYDMFSFMDGNRGVGDARIKILKESINDVGLLQSAPIIVNEEMQIIDGQGRYTVCKELGLPIYFTIQAGAGIRECIAMNTSSTKWKTEDYIHSYARQGYESYKFIEEQMDKYRFIHPITIASVCADVSTGNVLRRIRDGNFQLDAGAMREAELSLAWIATMSDKINALSGKRDAMIFALNWIYRHSSASKSRVEAIMGQMVFDANAGNIAVGSIKHALQLIEGAYNYKLGKHNRIRLVVEYEDYQNGTHAWYEKKWGRDERKAK